MLDDWTPPARLDLWYGSIALRKIDRAAMRDLAGCDPGDETPDGCWDTDTETIYLGDWLRGAALRRVFWHEMVHAVIDMDYASVTTSRRAR